MKLRLRLKLSLVAILLRSARQAATSRSGLRSFFNQDVRRKLQAIRHMLPFFSQSTQEALLTFDITPHSIESIMEWFIEHYESDRIALPAGLCPRLEDIRDKTARSNISTMQANSPQRSVLRCFFALALSSQQVSKALEWLATYELNKRIQVLPQELQDLIFDFNILTMLPPKEGMSVEWECYELYPTTQNNPSGFVLIHGPTFCREAGYTPPIALQISRKSRSKFAEMYYSNTVFYFPTSRRYSLLERSLSDMGSPYQLCRMWLQSLTAEHRSMIRTIKHASIEPRYLVTADKDYSSYLLGSRRESFLSRTLGVSYAPTHRRVKTAAEEISNIWGVQCETFAILTNSVGAGEGSQVWRRLESGAVL